MSPPRRNPVTKLSRRERQCLLWIARGKGYIEVGMIEGIAYATVKCYLDIARYKLNCATLAAATALAVGRGIFTLEEIESSVLDDPDAADKDMKQAGDKQDQPAPEARRVSPDNPRQQHDEHPETERA